MMGTKTFVVDEATFKTDVLTSEQPVLVDFWADWCGPCKMIAPIVDQIATEHEGKLRVAKMDADENLAVMQQYNIMSIPTLILFKGGQVVARVTGYTSKDKIMAHLAPHLG